METILAKSSGGGNSSSPIVKKEKKPKVKKSVLQLAMEHIPDGKYAELLNILEPHERR